MKDAVFILKKDNLFKYFKPVDIKKNNNDIAETDISESLDGLPGFHDKRLFLKRFNVNDWHKIFNDVGFSSYLKGIGLADIKISSGADEYSINYLKIYYNDIDPDNLLMDLRVTEKAFMPDKEICGDYHFDVPLYMILIEWLSLQNPFRKFDRNKPGLPGQANPGLGGLKYCFELMYTVGSMMVKDGYMDIPDHMSGAVMYSKKFKFFDPKHEAILRAVMRDLKDYPLRDITWGMITGTVIEEYKNLPQTYDPCEQIYATSERMKDYFSSRSYMSVYHKYYKRKRYRFNYSDMVGKREEILKMKSEADV